MYGEIEVPKELREFMPDRAEQTRLGLRNGADRQYRYGNLHIREYRDRLLVHTDRVDPRRDPLGHLIADAPEVLAGLACAALGGAAYALFSKSRSAPAGLLAAAASGWAGYAACKRIKESAR